MDPNHIPTTITATEDQNSKTTTNELDQANDMGAGRSYECVYCKRGFTTAQALGGHMNIHRKDRVKTKPNAANTQPSKPEPFSHHHSTTLPPSTTSLISTSHHQSFQTYFPTSNSSWCLGSTTTSTTPPYDHQLAYVPNNLNNNNNTSQVLNMFNENWTNMAHASRSPNLNLIDRQDRRSDGNDNDNGDDNDEELDLELRLGHDR